MGILKLIFYLPFVFIIDNTLAQGLSDDPSHLTPSFPGEFSGGLSLENRYYLEEGQFGNTDKSEQSLIIKPEYSYSWDNDRKVFTFIPYARLSDPDSEKTHMDIREASIVSAWDKWELRAGISKVYWGVTESQHLVDIINQIDAVENVDGEDRLGQPMIAPTYVSDYGNFTVFLMPFFRERTFPGLDGRYRSGLVVDTDKPLYEESDEDKHIDYALRWTHYFGQLEWGLGYFQGTNRTPQFVLDSTTGLLRPFYVQTQIYTLDTQYILDDWLFKLEAIYEDTSFKDSYGASVFGFEYTFSNIQKVIKGADIGVLYEFNYDERGNSGETSLYDHSFLAARFAFNDELGTEILSGFFLENDTGNISAVRVEASRRINNNWKWELEFNSVVNPNTSSLMQTFRDDDYGQFTLSYFY